MHSEDYCGLVQRDDYERLIAEIDDRSKPRLSTVLRVFLKSPRRGFLDASDQADETAAALAAVTAPEGLQAEHAAYIRSLRVIASDAREIAERRTLPSRRSLKQALQAEPSYREYVEARARLRSGLREGT